MLLTPAPALAIAFSESGISMSSILAERTSMASGFSMLLPTSYCVLSKFFVPTEAILLSVFILNIFGKLLHKCYEGINTLFRHRIVDGSSHAADAAVTFNIYKACFFSLFAEFLIEILSSGNKSNVHDGT